MVELLRRSVIPQRPEDAGQLAIVRGDGATVAEAAQILRREERDRRGAAGRAPHRPDGLRGVVQRWNPRGRAGRPQRLDSRRPTEQVDDQGRFGMRANQGGSRGGVEDSVIVPGRCPRTTVSLPDARLPPLWR